MNDYLPYAVGVGLSLLFIYLFPWNDAAEATREAAKNPTPTPENGDEWLGEEDWHE